MSVVTVVQYQAITGDTDSGDVEDALDRAQEIVEEYLRRSLAEGEYTETLTPDVYGRVFPSVTPITEADGYTIEGNAITGVFPGLWDSAANVTYTGGYTSATLPATIRFEIARAAYEYLHPTSALPVGATSVRLGDASVTFAKPLTGGFTPSSDLRRYRRRFI